jgi:hypothetical protein
MLSWMPRILAACGAGLCGPVPGLLPVIWHIGPDPRDACLLSALLTSLIRRAV